jgi:hypothetical protein
MNVCYHCLELKTSKQRKHIMSEETAELSKVPKKPSSEISCTGSSSEKCSSTGTDSGFHRPGASARNLLRFPGEKNFLTGEGGGAERREARLE